MNVNRWRPRCQALVAAAGMAVVTGCAGDEPALVGAPLPNEVAQVTVVSDDSTATIDATCVGDVPTEPFDPTDCDGTPETVGAVELDQTRKAALQLPAEVASGGYRLTVNGAPLPRLERVLGEQYLPFRVPVDVVQQPGPTLLAVQALRSTSHPPAVWQFLLSDPAGPPA